MARGITKSTSSRIGLAVASLVIGSACLLLGRKSVRYRPADDGEDTDPLASKADQIHLFRQIMDARADSVTKRAEQVSSRAGILIAAAALSATLGTAGLSSAWAVMGILFTLGAATAGVAAIFPMKDNYSHLPELRDRVLSESPAEAELLHADDQVLSYNERVGKLKWRSGLVRAGFVLLGVSIACRAALVLGLVVSIR